MIDLEQYRENARLDHLCNEYTNKWDSCKSNKQFFDMGTDSKGIDYLCDSVAKGWGISPNVIADRFQPYINGRYINDCGGYTSCLYVNYNDKIEVSTTLVGLINCNVNLYIPKFNIAKIYCSGINKINVSGDGDLIFICYGCEENTTIYGKCGNMKRINKKQKDSYGQE